MVEKEGFDIVLVTGGGETNGAFLKANMIDEVYLDVEPMVFGEGIPTFTPNDVNLKLEFVDSKMLNKNTIQLHYKVIK
jgi:dihydrofolate reductase